MAGSKKLEVIITGDSKGAQRAMSGAAKSADGMGKKFGGIGKKVAAGLGLGLVGAGVAFGAFVAQGFGVLANLEKINAQTANVIKSTGGAAGVAAKDVEKYAQALEKKTGIEQEGIQEGQNLLLTFTNIQNKVGQGNDIFNQATSIMTDMSVALGTDAKGSAIQLGKALNDPVKGVTALTKVGVSFTQQQKDQIKMMVASGNTLGAQKVILAELNKEFGGSAEAFGNTTAGKVAKLKNAFGDVQEEIAAKLLPIGIKLLQWAQVALPAAMAKLRAAFTTIQPHLQMVGDKLRGFGEAMQPVLAAIGRFIKANPKPVFAALAVVIGTLLVGALWSMASAMAAAFLPIYVVIGVVALLAAGLVWAYQNVDWFRGAVDAVASFITSTLIPALGSMWTWIKDNVIPILAIVAAFIVETVVPALNSMWSWFAEKIVPALMTVYMWVKDYIIPIFQAVTDKVNAAVIPAVVTLADEINNTLLPAFQITAGYLKGQFTSATLSAAGYLKGTLVPALQITAGYARSTFGPAIGTAAGLLRGVLSAAARTAAGLIRGPLAAGMAVASAAARNLGTAASAVGAWLRALGGIASSVGRQIGAFLSSGMSVARTAVSLLSATVGGLVTNLSNLISGARRAADAIKSIPSSIPGGGLLSKLPGFAAGGTPPVGTPYIVGENGPEIRIDKRPGVIIPNHKLAMPNRSTAVAAGATTRMMSSGGSANGAPVMVKVQVDVHGSTLASKRELADAVRSGVRAGLYNNSGLALA